VSSGKAALSRACLWYCSRSSGKSHSCLHSSGMLDGIAGPLRALLRPPALPPAPAASAPSPPLPSPLLPASPPAPQPSLPSEAPHCCCCSSSPGSEPPPHSKAGSRCPSVVST
jgi:hypothetical protein